MDSASDILTEVATSGRRLREAIPDVYAALPEWGAVYRRLDDGPDERPPDPPTGTPLRNGRS